MVRVRMVHVRAARLCADGARCWLARHGFSVSEFIRHGLPAEQLEATGDLFALRVAAIARQGAANG